MSHPSQLYHLGGYIKILTLNSSPRKHQNEAEMDRCGNLEKWPLGFLEGGGEVPVGLDLTKKLHKNSN